MAPPLCGYTTNEGLCPHTRYKCAWTCSHPRRERLATSRDNGMGRQDNDRTTGGVSRYLPHGANRRVQWSPRGRTLWIDIAIRETAELDWVHKQMLRREPCIAMVRVHYLIARNFWGYFTGAAVRDQYHLTTIGENAYDLMNDALTFSNGL